MSSPGHPQRRDRGCLSSAFDLRSAIFFCRLCLTPGQDAETCLLSWRPIGISCRAMTVLHRDAAVFATQTTTGSKLQTFGAVVASQALTACHNQSFHDCGKRVAVRCRPACMGCFECHITVKDTK